MGLGPDRCPSPVLGLADGCCAADGLTARAERADGLVDGASGLVDGPVHGAKPAPRAGAGVDFQSSQHLPISFMSGFESRAAFRGSTLNPRGRLCFQACFLLLDFEYSWAVGGPAPRITCSSNHLRAPRRAGQFFFLLFDPELVTAGRNLMDGRYGTFGSRPMPTIRCAPPQ